MAVPTGAEASVPPRIRKEAEFETNSLPVSELERVVSSEHSGGPSEQGSSPVVSPLRNKRKYEQT